MKYLRKMNLQLFAENEIDENEDIDEIEDEEEEEVVKPKKKKSKNVSRETTEIKNIIKEAIEECLKPVIPKQEEQQVPIPQAKIENKDLEQRQEIPAESKVKKFLKVIW